MAAVTSDTLPLCHRFMLELVAGHLSFNILMALQADLPRLTLDELVLIGAVRFMTGVAIAFGKR